MKKTIRYICYAALIMIIINLFIAPSGDDIFTPSITENSPYNKVNDLKRVCLKTSESSYSKSLKKIMITLQNDTDKEYMYGSEYHLEKYYDNEWYQLSKAPSNIYRTCTLGGYILAPHSQKEEEIDLEWIYGNDFEKGKYRIVKSIDSSYSGKPSDYDEFYLSAEFEITS